MRNIALVLVLGICTALPASAQFYTASPEACYTAKLHRIPVAPENTGTDATVISPAMSFNSPTDATPISASYVQADVWDGVNGGVGLTFYSSNVATVATSSVYTTKVSFADLNFPINAEFGSSGELCSIQTLKVTSLKDPDISIYNQGGYLRIVVVGILINAEIPSGGCGGDASECTNALANNLGRVIALRYSFQAFNGILQPIDVWGIYGAAQSTDPDMDYGHEVVAFSPYRSCSSPNVDINDRGLVAMVWTENGRTLIPSSLGLPEAASTDLMMPIDEGNVFCVVGDVTESNVMKAQVGGSSDKGLRATYITTCSREGAPKEIILEDPVGTLVWDQSKTYVVGMPFGTMSVLQAPTVLAGEDRKLYGFKSYRASDVSISGGLNPVISIVYMETLNFPNQRLNQTQINQLLNDYQISPGERMVVVQRSYSTAMAGVAQTFNGIGSLPTRYDQFTQIPAGTAPLIPRIASPLADPDESGQEDQARNCAVVVGDANGNCSAEGFNYQSSIRLYVLKPILAAMASSSTVNWGGSAVNEAPSSKRYGNSSPVLDFVGTASSCSIMVAWEITASPHVCNDLNIVGRTFNDAGGMLSNSKYSLVNALTRFNQKKPAIANVRQLYGQSATTPMAAFSYFSEHASSTRAGIKVGITNKVPGAEMMIFNGSVANCE
ncbi:hypothetical protein WDZ92_01275 [Nostoc sp. NIES-2111]